MTFRTFLLFVAFASPALGYYAFQEKIPNGNNVEHPCKVNYQWRGVGHQNPLGGGPRNVFGKDFASIGRFQWTQELCQRDSDGDGMTNGQELGDPNCEWSHGKSPNRTTDITHPGICNPYNSTKCKGRDTFVDCSVDVLGSCARVNESDTKILDLRFNQTTIPNTETNYFCQTFDVPVVKDYHIVAYEPIIDNAEVVHHMILYGCGPYASEVINTPRLCGMSNRRGLCSDIVGLWAVGSAGICYDGNYGYRFGNTSYKRFKLEIHYNNPKQVEGYKDASGMKIYFQPVKPGVNDLTTFTVGQLILTIPPGQSSVNETATCPGSCTRMLISKPAHIVFSANHMHYLGKSQKVVLYRNGTRIADLSVDEIYSYDAPVMHFHDPPIPLLPGDEIRTTCEYNSLSRRGWTYYGDDTSAEMCFAFLSVYPASSFRAPYCVSRGQVTQCDLIFGTPFDGCDWKTFSDLSQPSMALLYYGLEQNCNSNGTCRPECQPKVNELCNHPCMANTEAAKVVRYYLNRYREGIIFLERFQSCKCSASDGNSVVRCLNLITTFFILLSGTLMKHFF